MQTVIHKVCELAFCQWSWILVQRGYPVTPFGWDWLPFPLSVLRQSLPTCANRQLMSSRNLAGCLFLHPPVQLSSTHCLCTCPRPADARSQMARCGPFPEEGRPATRLETRFQAPVPCPAFLVCRPPLDPAATCATGFPHLSLLPVSPIAGSWPSATLCHPIPVPCTFLCLPPWSPRMEPSVGTFLLGDIHQNYRRKLNLTYWSCFSICEMGVSPHCNQ